MMNARYRFLRGLSPFFGACAVLPGNPASAQGPGGMPLNFGAAADMVFSAPTRDLEESEFDVRAFEINIGAPVDPYFDFLATLAWEDDEAELEEAWVSTVLPWNLKLKFGREFLPFGNLNPIHEHDYPQVNAPSVHEAFTSDGAMIGDGAHLEYLAPYLNPTLTLIVGVYDEVHGSVGRRIDGFPLLARAQSFYQSPLGEHALMAGASFLTSAGSRDPMEDRLDADGFTSDDRARGKLDYLFGLDLKYKYSPGITTYQGLVLGAEYLYASYDAYKNHADFTPGLQVDADSGFYVYAEWNFDRFRGVGYRYDRTDVLFSSLEGGAGMEGHTLYKQWRPTEFSRLRLQYQFADNDLEDETEHTVMLQATFFIGWHPPHRF
ncbi:MAG: hypothetical protein JJU29_08750 [Verrucomicrobia bacterium]|nr:hypothetical protein [Verrucomicrobiota bacterium]